jgi:hypothetical protein
VARFPVEEIGGPAADGQQANDAEPPEDPTPTMSIINVPTTPTTTAPTPGGNVTGRHPSYQWASGRRDPHHHSPSMSVRSAIFATPRASGDLAYPRGMVSAFQNLPVGLAAEDGAWLVPTAGRYAATQGRLVGL